jgi:hypothetical protein
MRSGKRRRWAEIVIDSGCDAKGKWDYFEVRDRIIEMIVERGAVYCSYYDYGVKVGREQEGGESTETATKEG